VAANPDSSARGVDVDGAWSRFKDRLHAFALRRVRSATEADDVVQDVLIRLLEHRDRIDSDRLAAWLFTTARNAMVDRQRKANRDGATATCLDADDIADDASSNTSRELSACVQPLLAMLPEADRSLLERVELAGDSQTELAAALDIPVSTVKSRVQRARQRLRDHFERCCSIALDGRRAPYEYTSHNDPKYPRCDGCSGP
jgi:RNA polymerase sigma-70 factor (ECF subfamily)